MTYNPDIHQRHSTRLREYDYCGPGVYFVTICAFQRESLFVEVVGEEVHLNELGTAVCDYWQAIPGYFPHVRLDEFVIMPNHFHAILHITDLTNPLGAQNNVGAVVVGAKQAVSASPGFGCHGNKVDGSNMGEAGVSFASPLQFQLPQPHGTVQGSLGSVIQNFKSVSTRKINKIRNNPGCAVWQRNYYEHIIRNETDLTKIRQYIINNPLKWELDENNLINFGKQ